MFKLRPSFYPAGAYRHDGIRPPGKYPDLSGQREYHEDPTGEYQHQRGGEQDRHLATGERE